VRAALRRRLPDIAAWLGLALATLAVCWPLGLTNRVLAGVDALTYFTPYWAHRMEALRAGHIPLWNPYLFSGTPFLANIQAAVLYPLHWPLSWLQPGQALVWSALLHAWLAAGFTYMLATRSLRSSRLAGFLAGLVFGLGGFTLARVENINQLNALAWLPAMLWLFDETNRVEVRGNRGSDKKLVSFVALTVVIALQLLAGHTQTTFINMVGLGAWAVFSVGWPVRRGGLARLLPLLAVVPALLLSAAQLLPTVELNGLGLRTGGLDYRQAVSFSLRPQLLLRSFLPPFGRGLDAAFGSEGYAEFAGYVGLTALLLAGIGIAAAVRAARRHSFGSGPALRAIVLLVLGAFLALGAYNPFYYLLWRFVPGFDLFRAPARWLELFAMGAALLAGLGLDSLAVLRLGRPRLRWRAAGRVLLGVVLLAVLGLLAWQRWPSWQTVVAWVGVAAAGLVLVALSAEGDHPDDEAAEETKDAKRDGPRANLATRTRMFRALLVALLFLELLLASRALPFVQATAPMATALRNAPAALLAATANEPPAGRDRFLSLSDIRYDPGDLAEIRALQANRLPASAIDRLVRAAKQVEVLAPNLPLLFRLPAVDGYDGGLLPLQRYVMLQQLFLPPDQMTPDGRLAEQLSAIPDKRLLDLTGVRFVITDKQRDLWAGDVYYDLEQAATVGPGGTLDVDLSGYPAFPATAVGIVAESAAPLAEPVTITVSMADGGQARLALAPAAVRAAGSAPAPSILTFPAPGTPTRIAIANPSGRTLTVRGMSLIDQRTGAHQSITLSPRGDFRRIHSGDVKVYERLGTPGRAWLVHGVTPVGDAAEAQAAVADSNFAPRAQAAVEAALAAAPPREAQPGESVTTLGYTDERQSYRVNANAAGLLVLADAWYPGWRATVDGQPAEILRANLLYRAIQIEPGLHEVALEYAPQTWRTGWIISLVTLVVLAAVLLAARFIR
jgi:hypothetical protein